MTRRWRIVALLLSFAIGAGLLSGCGVRGVQLFTHPNPKVPDLRGRTVAVFPPLALGAELGPAIVAGAALDAVFASELAGIQFLPPSEVIAQTRLSEDEAAALSERMSAFLPIHVAPKRKKTRLFTGSRVGDTRLGRELAVTLQRDPYPRQQLSPAVLPVEWLEGLDADFALLTVSFSTYHEVSRTATLFGILPFAWARELAADGPRALFALYEVETGARVWDIIVGVGNPIAADEGERAKERAVDLRKMPVVGAAYLLTGEIVNPLERAIRAPASD
jgi:hypothetical protein